MLVKAIRFQAQAFEYLQVAHRCKHRLSFMIKDDAEAGSTAPAVADRMLLTGLIDVGSVVVQQAVDVSGRVPWRPLQGLHAGPGRAAEVGEQLGGQRRVAGAEHGDART